MEKKCQVSSKDIQTLFHEFSLKALNTNILYKLRSI